MRELATWPSIQPVLERKLAGCARFYGLDRETLRQAARPHFVLPPEGQAGRRQMSAAYSAALLAGVAALSKELA